MSIDIDKLVDCELHFTEDFADYVVRPYGILYYNEENPNSWDSNHAIFTSRDSDPDTAIRDIIKFYRSKNLTPRIYSSLHKGELDWLRPYLEKYQFQIPYDNANRFFLKQNPSVITPVQNISINRVTALTPDIEAIIYSEADGGIWTVKVLERHLKHPHFHQLIGYVDGVAVTMASVKMMDGYSRVDDVMTHTSHLGKGYNSALMHYLINYHDRLSHNFLYLYASNPVAIRIYEKAGFTELPMQLDNWAAFQ